MKNIEYIWKHTHFFSMHINKQTPLFRLCRIPDSGTSPHYPPPPSFAPFLASSCLSHILPLFLNKNLEMSPLRFLDSPRTRRGRSTQPLLLKRPGRGCRLLSVPSSTCTGSCWSITHCVTDWIGLATGVDKNRLQQTRAAELPTHSRTLKDPVCGI